MKIAKKIIASAFALSLATSCNSQPATHDNDSIAKRTVVNEFFTWYINETKLRGPSYYQVPTYKKVAPKSYIFDIDDLKKRLRGIPFLSEKFKAAQVEKLKACNAEMQKVSWDSEPESQFNIRACDYLWYDNWVGGQGEDIDGFNIVDETETDNGNSAIFTVQITINGKPFTKSEVEVVRTDSTFKISSIHLNWKK